MTEIITSFADISQRYAAAFVDLWGCMHNGVSAYPDAVEAMRAFRSGGGKVVLLTNAPRSRAEVARQIEGLGIPEECYDIIATSGDAARTAMFQGAVGSRVFFMGEERDKTFFEPLQIVKDPTPIELVPLDEAEGIVCCGPFDPHAAPEELRPELLLAKTRGLTLLCANPDLIVDRGDSREYCAGAVAELYEKMGGEALYFGKPHPPIYDLARRRLASLGDLPADGRIVAIGDGIATDIAGAAGEDIDSLFITGGLAAEETRTQPGGQPEGGALGAFLQTAMMTPTYAMGFLR
ncbi:TIGR01459 family HAD-type hydrolase [Pseudoroseicyclus tamaricis]|uniref:TIGR01459 family HAD-type hydrolase n=1 Tax=Pseudoroseicyclus tamaricis TaxID=2705421 RepID=A0A6B2JPP8_9RHOB|nr:TIGR01459 family HAD-type hydrolase [Pseudoroseicyclus tamaricis]NDU99934.1 TIGR01459 family HAD-type hydrolase [Pseudoroseicyclus tamaricis]